jgi:aryl-alcohol dehydrogenase-like predicted oxidoreductase
MIHGRHGMRRRDFLRHGSAASGAALLGLSRFPHALYAAEQKKTAQDMIALGKSGIEVSRLAQGTGTYGVGHQSRQTRLGLEGLAELFRAGVDQGLNFWDVGDNYGSHAHVKEALKTVPRDKVVIMTKLNISNAKKVEADLDRIRQEMGADMVDIVLMHYMHTPDWSTLHEGPMAALSEAKEKGLVRAVGVSCHSIGALEAAAATDWVEVLLARFNPVGVEMDTDADTVTPVLEGLRRRGKGVIGMKILGQGFLREEVDPALQFALASPALDAFTIGAENRAELEDLLRKIPAASVRG